MKNYVKPSVEKAEFDTQNTVMASGVLMDGMKEWANNNENSTVQVLEFDDLMSF